MTPGARIQTAIDLLAEILSTTMPADQAMTQCFRQRRYIGSHDRREISEMVYQILRQRLSLGWGLHQVGIHESSRHLVWCYCLQTLKYTPAQIMQLFSGEQYHPSAISHKEQSDMVIMQNIPMTEMPLSVRLNTPAWIFPYFERAFGAEIETKIAAMNEQAPLDLRVNTLKTTRDAVLKILAQDEIPAVPTPYSPWGIRLGNRRPLGQHRLWQEGLIEVQDEGSQLIALLTDAQSGAHVMDFCAGAGGKTLALAAQMGNKGRLVASDVVAWRLEKSRQRLRRAGVHNVENRVLDASVGKWLKRQAAKFDRVLVDAPCSGTGTWRRNPDLKWRTTETDLQEVLVKQQEILRQAAPLVKIGGRLIYATCSILIEENVDQVTKFLNHHPQFTLKPIEDVWADVSTTPCPLLSADGMMQLSPQQHATDGFFMAVLERKESDGVA